MTTRGKKKIEIKVDNNTSITKRVENSWVLVMKDTLFENDNFSIVTLPHPGHGQPTKYCLDDDKNKIYELVTFSEPHRSWFIGETVKSDGGLLMVTPVNPIFLVLPRLQEQCLKRAIPLEDLLSEKGFDKIQDFVFNLGEVADLKGPADIKAYKYNEDKTLAWLEAKVRKLAKVLRQKNIHVTSGAVSTTFVASNIDNDCIDEEFYLKYAHGMISEYLQDDLKELLEKKFDFRPDLIECIGRKRKSEARDENDTKKRVKCESYEIEFEENILNKSITENKKQKPLTAKEKARQKAASGTKTLSTFFTKK